MRTQQLRRDEYVTGDGKIIRKPKNMKLKLSEMDWNKEDWQETAPSEDEILYYFDKFKKPIYGDTFQDRTEFLNFIRKSFGKSLENLKKEALIYGDDDYEELKNDIVLRVWENYRNEIDKEDSFERK